MPLKRARSPDRGNPTLLTGLALDVCTLDHWHSALFRLAIALPVSLGPPLEAPKHYSGPAVILAIIQSRGRVGRLEPCDRNILTTPV